MPQFMPEAPVPCTTFNKTYNYSPAGPEDLEIDEILRF
jgi:hypothetical protein